MRLSILLALWVLFAAGGVRADDTQLTGCTDAAGRPVRVDSDPELPVLVKAVGNGAQRSLKVNPERLPELSATARQFFYARACAALSLPGGADASPARAHQADCLGVAALQASGLLAGPEALAALQGELVFSEAAWEQLPGPPRAFQLERCPQRGVVVLPRATPPSASQLDWNACVRACSDRLFTCQRQCAGGACADGCVARHGQCEAGCPKP